MNLLTSLIAVLILTLLGVWFSSGAGPAHFLTGFVPYAAFAVFVVGFVYRVLQWAKAPVPFRITATCGQQQSLPWLKRAAWDNPSCLCGVIMRMALEILAFRSLFRNTKMTLQERRPVYGSSKWLWLFALLFHVSFFVIVLRHLRFFFEPIVPFVNLLSSLDGFFELGIPTLYMTDALILAGLLFLLFRRIVVPQLRYISLITDYFSVLLILGIVTTGILMRHFFPADLLQVKNLAMGWVTFSPVKVEGVGAFFYIHLSFVFTLMVWFPMSKLMHMGGVFLSPTRNLANNNRMKRHINPWNAPVKVHTYAEYEDEFRDKMKLAGLPVDKE